MSERFSKARREALKVTAWTLTAATGSLLTCGRAASAQEELPHLSEDDDMAQALMYVHDATTSTSPLHSENEFCYNCEQFMGTRETTWAGCAIFPGKAVNAEGWCSVWVEKQE